MRARAVLFVLLLALPIVPAPSTALRGPEGSELAYWRFDAEDHDVPSPGRTADASGNGLHLTRINGPGLRASPDLKWAGGYNLDGSNDYLKSTDSRLRVTGDLSLLIVFEKDTSSTQQDLATWGAVGDSLGTNILYMMSIQTNGKMYYFHEHGSGLDTVKYSLATIPNGFHVLTLRRDAVAKTVEIKVDGVYMIGGPSGVPAAYASNPEGGTSGFFSAGSREAASGRFLNGGLYEMRVWNRAVEWDTLDALAARSRVPTAPTSLVAVRGDAPGEVDLAWSPPFFDGDLDLVGYDVLRDGALVASVDDVTAFTDTGLAAGASHTYTVRARNALGAGPDSEAATAAAPEVPGLVAGLAASPGPGPGAISLGWSAPASDGGLPVTSYRVYRDGAFVAATSDAAFLDSGLGPSAAHTYEVAAVNGVGEGARAGPVEGATFGVPSAPLDVVAARGPGAGALSVAWAAPVTDGGLAVTAYRVYADGALLVETTEASAAETGLGPGVERAYEVAAVSAAGEGARSAPVRATTFPLPSAPRDLVGRTGSAPGEVDLEWAAPAEGTDLPVTYRVWTGATLLAETASTAFTVTNLTPGQGRAYHVTARTDAGEGPASSVVEAYAPKPPADPENATVHAEETAFRITWSAPASDGGLPVLHYRVARYESGEVLGETSGFEFVDAWGESGEPASSSYLVIAVNAVGASAGAIATLAGPIGPLPEVTEVLEPRAAHTPSPPRAGAA